MTPLRITSLIHKEVKRWTCLRQEASERERQKRVLIQGKKMVEEVAMRYPLYNLIVTDAFLEASFSSPPPAEKVWLVTQEIMKKVTGAVTPEGIAAEVDLPREQSLLSCLWILALDGVSDPGNVGTLLRTAYAFGWDGIYLLPGSCDPYNDKALRASMGATFHLKCRSGSHEEFIALQKGSGIPCYSADLTGVSVESVIAKTPPQAALLVLGSESHGLSTQIRLNSQRVTIPIRPQVDSLNVAIAGGIMLYMLRQGCVYGMG